MTPSNQSERTRHPRENDRSEESERSPASTSERGAECEQTPETCPECNGPLERDSEHGELACGECGLVVEDEEIDHGPEWRAFNEEERTQKKRTGAPTTHLMHDKGLSTTIDWRDSDAAGNTLSSRQRRKMSRLRTWNERFRTRNARERNLKQALSEISRMAGALGLPKATQETAGVIYRRALDDDLLPGRSIEGVATAAVYAAARQAGMPRSLDELVTVSRIGRIELMRTYRYVERELGLEIAPADPLDYLPRFASDLGVSDEAEQRARELLETTMAEGYLSGKNPVGLAAAALYASALLVNEKVTQGAVGEVADVSEVTIRNRYKELLELDGIQTP
jgi:transcription initiation factor TFIIB